MGEPEAAVVGDDDEQGPGARADGLGLALDEPVAQRRRAGGRGVARGGDGRTDGVVLGERAGHVEAAVAGLHDGLLVGR